MKQREHLKRRVHLLDALESIAIVVLPTYLYGWRLGLLITSGLSSLLEIAIRLRPESKEAA